MSKPRVIKMNVTNDTPARVGAFQAASILAVLVNVAWVMAAVVTLPLFSSVPSGTPESGFAGMELLFVRFPLWLVCMAPSLPGMFGSLTLAQSAYEEGDTHHFWLGLLLFVPTALMALHWMVVN